ncbi:MAG: acetyl-CoA carboxylase biotin carboxylase subunit [Bryobacterales bacterium]|nr:acetyl-CoA carboxylase biotin carboxylase subunit [Bryobacterales bacterium]
MFGKVLVANRGEIAVRVIRALREMGIASVAVYSDVDRAALHVRMADEAVAIGPAPSSESYLRGDKILDAARATGAEAIHPGYGFLSENAEFAAACEAAGLVFIGPPAKAIQAMGLKTEARRMAIAAGVPVVPGAEDPVDSLAEARRIARQIGYPVILKAAAGGGGKGMRRVFSETELEAALRDATSEAERSFKSGAVYLEKLIEKPRHVEIQILGDQFGHMIHLGERECSLQRRHQKVMEECPSPLVSGRPEMRRAMGEAAVRAAQSAGYWNAGTVEFLVDANHRFYFLEMNTRLQVEHPVTELVTGLDLVHWQLRIAAGQPLTIQQHETAWRGWAIECRICAEDPDNQFLPSPGTIRQLDRPSGPGIRIDSGVYAGWTVPLDYDPLLAKIIVWAETRDQAIARMRRVLSEYFVQGIKTNISFLREILEDEFFQQGDLHTGLIEEFFVRRKQGSARTDLAAVAALVSGIHRRRLSAHGEVAKQGASAWLQDGRSRLLR